MDIHLHDTLSGARQRLVPLEPGHVRMYVCGPTVYDLPHLGNARPVVVFDTLARLLRRAFPQVTYVRNLTDIDDKIIDRSRSSGEPMRALTDRVATAFRDDMAALGALPPDVEPRATEHVGDMIAIIERLITRGHAYEGGGHVLFDVRSNPNAGILSGHHMDALRAGASERVEPAPWKRDPADFVLWKPSPNGTPGWESPWGFGRPGWHIECSAMSWRHLGKTFDLHGGGQDLVFPHHENEIAQSTCAFGTHVMANLWVHNGMLLVDGRKMAKSAGNFTTVRDVLGLGPWAGQALRLLLLRTHYRSPLDYTRSGLDEARRELDRFNRALEAAGDPGPADAVPGPVEAALSDDLNTPLAISGLHALADAAFADPATNGPALKAAGMAMGLLRGTAAAWFRAGAGDGTASIAAEEVEAAIARRAEARERRDWAEADRVRRDLAAAGVLIEDGKTGTAWRRA